MSFITYEEATGILILISFTGKQLEKYRPQNEIIKALDLEKEELKNITGKCRILNLTDYVDEYHKEAVKNGQKKITPPENVFFYRQQIDLVSKKLLPDLGINCTCRKILNPNDTLIMCPNSCGNFYHPICLMMNSERS